MAYVWWLLSHRRHNFHTTYIHIIFHSSKKKVSKRTAFPFFFAIEDTLAIEQNNIDRWNIRRNSRFDNGRRFIGHMWAMRVSFRRWCKIYLACRAGRTANCSTPLINIHCADCHYVVVTLITLSFPHFFFQKYVTEGSTVRDCVTRCVEKGERQAFPSIVT